MNVSDLKLPEFIYEMHTRLTSQLTAYTSCCSPSEIDHVEILNQLNSLKELLNANEKEKQKWFNSVIIKNSLSILEQHRDQSNRINDLYNQVRQLKFGKKVTFIDNTQDHTSPLVPFFVDDYDYLAKFLFEDDVPIPDFSSPNDSAKEKIDNKYQDFNMSNDLPVTQVKQEDDSLHLPELSNEHEVMPTLTHNAFNLEDWLKRSLENRVGYLIKILKDPSTNYPLSEENKKIIDSIIEEMQANQDQSSFASCVDIFTHAFTSLKESPSQLETQKIISQLMCQHPLRCLIISELKAAIHPIMDYLANQKHICVSQTVLLVRDLQDVLRRWNFIEKNHFFESQEDPIECLQALFDFLQEAQGDQSSASRLELHWEATVEQNESDWKYQLIDIHNPDYEIQQFLLKIGKSFLGTGAVQVAPEHLIDFGKNCIEQWISTGNLRDVQGQEIEDVPLLKDVLKPHVEKHKFPFIINIPILNEMLIKDNNLDTFLQTYFKEVNDFTGYQIKDGYLQKVIVPVQKTTIQMQGHPPKTLILQPQAFLSEDQLMTLPQVMIPAEMSFAGHSYVLTKSSLKTGTQHAGHYTFCSINEHGRGQYADSLDQENFIQTLNPLDKIISDHRNVTLLEYQRKDINPQQYIITQKLYQGLDNLCYLIQALYFIYGNDDFSSIKQVPAYSSLALPLVSTSDVVSIQSDVFHPQNDEALRQERRKLETAAYLVELSQQEVTNAKTLQPNNRKRRHHENNKERKKNIR